MVRRDRTSSEDSIGQNIEEGKWNTEAPNPYMSWNNSLLEKHPRAELGIEPRTT